MSTNPKAFDTATPVPKALEQVRNWLESPRVRVLHEPAGYWKQLESVVEKSGIRGPRIHDARIFAICLASGVSTLWTADRDFHRFKGLRLVNPLL